MKDQNCIFSYDMGEHREQSEKEDNCVVSNCKTD